jgi:hypothetical protein
LYPNYTHKQQKQRFDDLHKIENYWCNLKLIYNLWRK